MKNLDDAAGFPRSQRSLFGDCDRRGGTGAVVVRLRDQDGMAAAENERDCSSRCGELGLPVRIVGGDLRDVHFCAFTISSEGQTVEISDR